MDEGWIKLHRSIMDHPLYHTEPFTRLQAWIDLLLMANINAQTMLVRGVQIAVERGQVVQSKDYLAGRWRWSRSKVKRYFRLLEDEGMIIQQNSTFISKITIVNYEKYQENDPNLTQNLAQNLAKNLTQRLTQQTTQQLTQQLTQAVNQVKTDGKSCKSVEFMKALEDAEPSERPTDEPINEPKDGPKDDPQQKNNIIKKKKNSIHLPSNACVHAREDGVEFEVPKKEEVEAYAKAAELKMNVQAFIDYYEMRGWRVSTGPMKSWRAAARMWARKGEEITRDIISKRAVDKREREERKEFFKQQAVEREAERKKKSDEREERYRRMDEEREARYKRQDEEREAARKRKEEQKEAAAEAEKEARAAKRRAQAAGRRAAGTNRRTENSGSRFENSGSRLEINKEFTQNIDSHEQTYTHQSARRDSRAAQLERERAEREAQLHELIARTLASGEA